MKDKTAAIPFLILAAIALAIISLIVWLKTPMPMFKNPEDAEINIIRVFVEDGEQSGFATLHKDEHFEGIDTEKILDTMGGYGLQRFPRKLFSRKVVEGHTVNHGDLELGFWDGSEFYSILLSSTGGYGYWHDPSLERYQHNIVDADKLYSDIMALLPDMETLAQTGE